MENTEHTAIRSDLAVRNYGGLILLGHIAITIVAMGLLYFSSSGPSVTEAELAVAMILP